MKLPAKLESLLSPVAPKPNLLAKTSLRTSRSTGGSETAVTRAGRVCASGWAASKAFGLVALGGGATVRFTGASGAGLGSAAAATAAGAIAATGVGGDAAGRTVGRLGGKGAATAA